MNHNAAELIYSSPAYGATNSDDDLQDFVADAIEALFGPVFTNSGRYTDGGIVDAALFLLEKIPLTKDQIKTLGEFLKDMD